MVLESDGYGANRAVMVLEDTLSSLEPFLPSEMIRVRV
jgi:hypothetical protein